MAAPRAVGLVHGMIKHREKALRRFQYGSILSGFISKLFDVLGIGSLAPTLATYKLTKTVDDDLIPERWLSAVQFPLY